MIVGVKESSLLNKIFTILNIVVICFIFVSGVFKADINNWKLDPKVKRRAIFFFGGQKQILKGDEFRLKKKLYFFCRKDDSELDRHAKPKHVLFYFEQMRYRRFSALRHIGRSRRCCKMFLCLHWYFSKCEKLGHKLKLCI